MFFFVFCCCYLCLWLLDEFRACFFFVGCLGGLSPGEFLAGSLFVDVL